MEIFAFNALFNSVTTKKLLTSADVLYIPELDDVEQNEWEEKGILDELFASFLN